MHATSVKQGVALCTMLDMSAGTSHSFAPDCQHSSLMQADYALSRLVTLKDRTEATESLAKMHLAQRRNELVSFDLMLTVISINISFFGGVAAICGMNLWLAGSGAPKARHVALYSTCSRNSSSICMHAGYCIVSGNHTAACFICWTIGLIQLRLLVAGILCHLHYPGTGLLDGSHGCNLCICQTSPTAADSISTLV